MDGGAGSARRKRRTSPAASTNAVDIALDAVSGGKALDDDARSLLAGQRRLIDWQTANERAAFALRLLTGAAGLAVALAAGLMVWSASRANGLVVEAFSVPPDLAAKGITGEMAARQVMDRLNAMQEEDDSFRPRRLSVLDGEGEVRIEIPQTGVSLGELQRWLRDRLGNERRATGEIFRTPEGLKLTIRVNGGVAETASGSEADLDALFSVAADGLYRRSDPLRYARNLNLRDPVATQAWVAPLLESGTDSDRGYAHIVAGNVADDPHEALAHYRKAASLDPALRTVSLNNSASTELALGWDALALSHYLLGRTKADVSRLQLNELRRKWNTEAAIAGLMNDAGAAETAYVSAMRLYGRDTPVVANYARTLARLNHEPERALRVLGDAPRPLARAIIAREMGNWAEVERQILLAFEGEATGTAALPARRLLNAAVNLRPRLAEALAEQGRHDQAAEAIRDTPLDCYFCVRMRGRVAALAGRTAEADHWYGEAVKMAPGLSAAEAEWGEVLLRRGDADGAIARLKEASRKAPRFADPLELWGEALLAKGDAAGALAKLEAAAQLTPNWGRLHLLWGDALAKVGRRDEARAHWVKAARLDLTPAERGRLASLQEGR